MRQVTGSHLGLRSNPSFVDSSPQAPSSAAAATTPAPLAAETARLLSEGRGGSLARARRLAPSDAFGDRDKDTPDRRALDSEEQDLSLATLPVELRRRPSTAPSPSTTAARSLPCRPSRWLFRGGGCRASARGLNVGLLLETPLPLALLLLTGAGTPGADFTNRRERFCSRPRGRVSPKV